jgi:hypothetical protein
MQKAIVTSMLLLGLAACAEKAEMAMPAAFPQPKAAVVKSCPELAGSYRNMGVQQDGSGVFLSNLMGIYNTAFDKPEARALAYRRVAQMNAVRLDFFQHETGALDVTARAVDRDLILHPLPGKGQELRCEQGWLQLVVGEGKLPFGLSREILAFARSSDGGLLVKREERNLLKQSLQRSPSGKALGWYYFPAETEESRTAAEQRDIFSPQG